MQTLRMCKTYFVTNMILILIKGLYSSAMLMSYPQNKITMIPNVLLQIPNVFVHNLEASLTLRCGETTRYIPFLNPDF